MAVVKITTPAQVRAVFGKNNVNATFSEGLLNLLQSKSNSIVYVAGSKDRAPMYCLESEIKNDSVAVPSSVDYKGLSKPYSIKFLSNADMDDRIAMIESKATTQD